MHSPCHEKSSSNNCLLESFYTPGPNLTTAFNIDHGF